MSEKESGKHKALFQPITIGKVEIKNRIAMAPMCTHHATPDGYVNEQVKAWFAARARGGAGLIITSPVPGDPKQRVAHANLQLYDWSHKLGMSELAETIHSFGAKVFLQTGPGTGRQFGQPSPSPIPCETPPEMLPPKTLKEHEKRGLKFVGPLEPVRGVIPPVITIEEIVHAEDCCANTAFLARDCGYDGVEIHVAHGQLGHQFFSTGTNKRTDIYGGSFENRTRILRNILTKARQKVGRDFCLGIRISGEEHMPGGLTHDEVREICKQIEPLVDYAHLSDGSYEALKYFLPDEDGTMLKYAESLKKVLKVPVITPSIHSPDVAAQAMQEGKTDMVALGRALIADPEWVNKVATGKRPVKCLRCNIGCLRWFAIPGLPTRCEVNPVAGLEQYVPEYRPSKPFRKHWIHKTWD